MPKSLPADFPYRTAVDAARQVGLLRFFTEETDLLVYDYDVHEESISWYGPIEETLGYPMEHIPAAEWKAAIHPEDRGPVEKTREQALACGDKYAVTYRFQNRTGQYVQIRDHGIAFPGAKPRLVGVMLNISPDELPQGEAMRKILARTATTAGRDFLQTFTREICRSLDCHRAFVARMVPNQPPMLRIVAAWQNDDNALPPEIEIYNSPARLALEQGYYQTPDDVAALFPQWAQTEGAEKPECFAGISLRSGTGTTLGLLAVYFALRKKPPSSLAAIMRMFATRAAAELERLLLEQELEASQANYRQVVDGLPEGVLTVRKDRVLFANPAAARLLGYATTAELVGGTVSAHLPTVRQGPLGDAIRQLEEGNLAPFFLETILLRRDGSECEVDLIASRFEFEGRPALQLGLRDISGRLRKQGSPEAALVVHPPVRSPHNAKGEVTDCVGAVDDISALMHAAEENRRSNAELEKRVAERTTQLAAANAELEAFSYSVSHDLRGPLRAINGFGRALEEDCAAQLDPTARGYLQRIRAASQRMDRLIDDLLRLSRASRMGMRRETVNLSALAEELSMELRSHYPGHNVAFDCAPELHANADSALARIVLLNLLDNAWKYTRRQAAPRVAFQAHDSAEIDAPVFVVRDNGAGFDMRHAGRLFSPFHRLHAPSDFEGSGIGLATVKRILARHGGRAWADAAIAQGANFYFTFGK